jgi:hypothetical protein
MCSQFTKGCSNFEHKGAQFFGQGPTDRMSTALRHLGASVKNITCTTTRRYCRLRLTMERTVFGHCPILQETMSGLRRMSWSSLKMDSGLHPTVRSVPGQTNILPTVIKYADTHANHIDLTKQATPSCSHHFAGIWASTTTKSTKHSSKRNYLQFAAPLMGKDMGRLTRSFAGKDFIDGNLDKSVFF